MLAVPSFDLPPLETESSSFWLALQTADQTISKIDLNYTSLRRNLIPIKEQLAPNFLPWNFIAFEAVINSFVSDGSTRMPLFSPGFDVPNLSLILQSKSIDYRYSAPQDLK
jgi:hypothetical protein